ncbi:MAG: mechanosensitive ion channel domain-containing protein [Ilumatobacter sp.]|uniref:mechanosensitive ion channel domain-containing protein n=1 Tax=Ilumatobacter sp. TaxID=1967498 RepID=UPI003299A2FE
MTIVPALEVMILFAGAWMLAWVVRRVIRASTRRAVRLAQERPGTWRLRLPRVSEVDTEVETRRRQRADAAARMFGHIVTSFIFVAAAFIGLQLVGVNPVYAVSSAGFLGVAIALSCQEIIRNVLTGTLALLEDRYAVGDDVLLALGGNEVRGTVDLMGPASIRLRTADGATWHAGHSSIDSVTNFSQVAAVAELMVPTEQWNDVEDVAAKRLAAASNDVGLTGVIFLPELTAMAHPTGVTTVQVRSNKPLSDGQKESLHERLVESTDSR